ncbi:MAG TPA: GTPase Era [Syntrophobacteraceae bacterium]|nr:GTPase Era [Syntrophobacteraceae bacterium]
MAEFRSGYVALIGAANVGKSTLMNHILQQKISITSPKAQTTRNRILGILTRPDCQMIFLDTPGIHRAQDSFNKILLQTALAALREVDVICFVVEAGEAHREINQYALQFLSHIRTPVILAINKIDLVRKTDLLPIMDRYRGLRPFHAIVPISALLGDGVAQLLAEALGCLPEGPKYYPDDSLTDQPERFLVAELIREKVFHLTRQEIPYAIAVSIDTFHEDEGSRRIDIEATIHVERSSQKGILIGKKGEMLKEIGKLARQDIERMLGCHVFLGLFVRVQKNWRKDPRVLAEFGFDTRE